MTESLSRDERETTITSCDADELVRIWSAQRRHISKMRDNLQFTEVASGFHGTTEWAEFTIPADRWSPVGVKRRIALTEQQRNDRRMRLEEARRG